MKTTALLTASAVLAAESQALLGLKGHHLLSREDKITPFESIAYIDTYDEIPIFGGEELRTKMLNQAKHAKEQFMGMDLDAHAVASQVQQGIQKVSKQVHEMASIGELASMIQRSNHRDQTVNRILADYNHLGSSSDEVNSSGAFASLVSLTVSVAAAAMIMQ